MAQEEEYQAPRHGRHAAAGRHAAPRVAEADSLSEELPTPVSEQVEAVPQASVPQTAAPQREASPIPDLVPVSDGDQETSMGNAPRPIDVDPEETGSFRRINASEGARVTTRANASQAASFRAQSARPVEAVRMSSAGRPRVVHRDVEVQSNKRVFVALGVAALIMVSIVGWLIVRALTSVEHADEKPVAEQTQAGIGEGIEYRGTTYALTELSDGVYALTSTTEGAESSSVLCELQGKPVSLILHDMVFIVPENLADSKWDLIAYPLGGVTQQVTDAEGNPIIGEGEITEATLEGDAIHITTAAGENMTVSLV